MRAIAATLVVVTGLSVSGPVAASPARGDEPEGPTPSRAAEATDGEDAPPAVGELSQQGGRRGGLEIGLGVVLSGAALGLIAFGAVQLVRARDHVEFCRDRVDVVDDGSGTSSGGIDPCVFDPPALGFASAGLSWGFSIPLLVGGGLLFARAHRVRRDARAFERVRVGGWWDRSGGGVRLRASF